MFILTVMVILPPYFFSAFFVLTVYFLMKKFSMPVSIGYCFLNWMLLIQTIPALRDVNDYCNTITKNYNPFLQYDRVYILNMPTYYKGVAAFRSAFAETVYMQYNRAPAEKISVISGCYQETLADSLVSVLISGDTVTIKGPKKKTPFFSTNAGWAKSYESNEYKVDFDSSGCNYTLVFKQEMPKNSAIVYLNNVNWKKAN